LRLSETSLLFVIADVSGKGVPAALFMAVSKTLLKATALKGGPPEECLQQINHVLHLESVSAMFVTIFYGILNTRTGEVDYCNGGHNPPYILRADGGVEMAESTGGLVLGAMRNTAYNAKKMTLQAGEGVFLYTDGVTEAMNHDNEQFSEERLEERLKAGRNTALPNIVGNVVEAVKTFADGAPQADDITILALRYLGK
jgi:sigma-B regulation protein RsbU (phosphoserine phosphatase)